MKLYIVRISPCCRIVWLYCLQNNLKVDLIDVDVFRGEHKTEDFQKLNPHCELPILVDGELKISGACPILLYLGEKYTSFNRFGETQKEILMVKSMLSWASNNLHQVVGYRVVYPNFMESYQLKEDATEKMIEKGTNEVTRMLEIIENVFLMKYKYLTGNFPTVADFYVATIILQLEWINFDFQLWPNITAWLTILKGLQQWREVHEKHYGFVAELNKSD